MNYIKKIVFLSSVIALFSLNTYCMEEPINTDSQPTPTRIQTQTQIIHTPFKFLNILDYITQFGSIYTIDSNDEIIVDGLAKARLLMNGILSYENLKYLYQTGLININLYKIITFLQTYNAINNGLRDYKIWGNSSSIASQNEGRKEDIELKKKKSKHYIWLTVNKILPSVVQELTGAGIITYLSIILTKCSEIQRQRLMYALIENQAQKA